MTQHEPTVEEILASDDGTGCTRYRFPQPEAVDNTPGCNRYDALDRWYRSEQSGGGLSKTLDWGNDDLIGGGRSTASSWFDPQMFAGLY